MTKKKILTYGSILAIALFFGVGVSQTNAFWGGNRISVDERVAMQQTMFDEQAKLLGLTVEEVKNAWANGQNIWELAKSKGITEETLKAKMLALKETKIKEELKALVDKGVITQAQADARLNHMQTMKDRMTEKIGKGKGKDRGHMNWMPGMLNF